MVRARARGPLMNRRGSLVAGALVVVLFGVGAPRAFADGGSGGKGGSGSSGSGSSGSGSGSPGSGSGNSGSGSSGSSGSATSGSGSGSSSSVPDRGDDDDRPATTIAEQRATLPLTTLAPSIIVVPPATVLVPAGGATTSQAPSTPTKAPKQFVRTTSCGSQTLRVEVRAESVKLRVRTAIDRSTVTWRGVVLQDRRLAWSGAARQGRIDRSLVDLPGPETLTVRLTNSAGVVCAADLQLPA